jgi:hypothetical protein
MKFFLTILSISFVLIVIYILKPYKDTSNLPKFSDFKYHDIKIFTVQKALTIKIDSCLANVNITLHEEDNIKIESANDVPLIIEYSDDTMNIYTINQGLVLCNNNNDINANLQISVPNDLIYLNMEIDAFFTMFNGLNLNADTFIFKCNDSDFSLGHSNLQLLNIDIFKGSINLDHIMSEKVDLYTTSGLVHLSNSEINDKIEIKLSKGDITLNNVKTNIIISEVTLGNTQVNGLNISTQINLINENGEIELENTYCSIIYLKLKKGNISFKNDDDFYFIDLLEYSLLDGEANFILNGNIIKV